MSFDHNAASAERIESLIDDLKNDIEDALDQGLSETDVDTFGARVADISSEIDALEREGAEVDRLRSLLDGTDALIWRPDISRLDESPAPAPESDSPALGL